MRHQLHRRRKAITALMLGFWLFALFVGIAQACGWDASHSGVVESAVKQTDRGDAGSDAPPGCAEFCVEDLPLVAKVTSVQDPPSGPYLLASMRSDPSFAAVVAATHRSPSSSEVAPEPILHVRFLRLSL